MQFRYMLNSYLPYPTPTSAAQQSNLGLIYTFILFTNLVFCHFLFPRSSFSSCYKAQGVAQDFQKRKYGTPPTILGQHAFRESTEL